MSIYRPSGVTTVFKSSRKQKSIHIGELHASREPTVIYTLLGSCVAVCIFDLEARIGGMNHILLPGKPICRGFDIAASYGINAMELLINRIMGLGGDRGRLLAKVFGGAHLLPSISKQNGVGEKNILCALEFLDNESIRVISQDLGGYQPRKIFFRTDTGEVLLKRVPTTIPPRVVQEEQKLLKRNEQEINRPGSVVMFK
ncbi:MAG: chemotaxis protein CheD [Deltaproteobacteria bacterium]|nr:chemotaxis protein CheD [Deltaproteobacteria bacterium]